MKVFQKLFSLPSIIFFTFILTYIVASLVMWVYNNYIFTSGLSMKSRLTTFVNKYDSTLKTQVFDDIYSRAQKCLNLQNKILQGICRNEVGNRIGSILKEEELANEKGYDWPNDLFFVKQVDNRFYQLGWNGELKDITPQVNKSLLSDTQSLISTLFHYNCIYFQVSSNDSACQVYERISLENNNKGYIVRIYPFTEENNIWFAFFMPLFGIMMLYNIPYTIGFGGEQIIFIALCFMNLVVASLASFVAFLCIQGKKMEKEVRQS